jgi:hypothetical protein
MPLVVKSGLNSANVDWLGPTPLTIPALGNSDESVSRAGVGEKGVMIAGW